MRSFTTPKGTELPLMDIKGKPYLSVQHRVMWFREDHPDWSIETEFVYIKENESLAKATIKDPNGKVLAMAHKCEDRKGFADFLEKSESSAIGRALGFLGYGTQFALDLEEGDRLADSPTNELGPVPTKEEYSSPYQGLDNFHPGDYKISFGKYKDKTIKEAVGIKGPHEVSNYIQFLEKKAKEDNKPLSKTAQEFIEHFDAFTRAFPEPKTDKSFTEKISRLKNEFGPPPFDDNEPWPPELA